MRVGARRLRSALRLFDAWLPPRVAHPLSSELRWLAGELGRARDLDVFQVETLAPMLASRPDDSGLAAWRDAAEAARTEAYAAVRAALASRRYALLVLRLGRFVESPSFRRTGGAAARDARAQPEGRRLLRHLAARMRNLGERLDQLSAQDLHRLRIRTKRLRYASELLGPLFEGKAPARTARRLAELQDALGHLNDLVNAEALIGQLRERMGTASPATARAEGFVLGYAARSAAAGRAELTHAWQRVARIDPFWEARS
jgi:CHAD domain-containing protein